MEIVALNKTALLEYVNSTVFKAEENLPISEHRAVSHANNPRANVNDVLLFLAKEGDELIGYMGILPDLFFPKNQTRQQNLLNFVVLEILYILSIHYYLRWIPLFY